MSVRGDIISHMLLTIGEGGVSYEASLHPTVQICNKVLDIADREFQSRGWWFNKERRVPLVPDNHSEIIFPKEALAVRVHTRSAPEAKQRYVRRSGKLYDNLKHTYKFESTVYADMVLHLPLDDLPAPAITYLMHYAADTVFLDQDGDEGKHNQLRQRTTFAWQNLKATELTTIGVNALDNNFSRELRQGIGASYGSGRNPNFIGG